MGLSPLAAFSNGDYALGFVSSWDHVRLDTTTNIMASSTWTTTKTVSMWIRPLGNYSCTPTFPSVARCDAVFGDAPRWWGISRGVHPPGSEDRIWVWNVGGPMAGQIQAIGIPYTVGEWMHVAMVHGGGQLSAYKNGVLIGSVASGPTQQPITGAPPRLYFGGLVESSTPYFYEGQIDEVQIWNVARTADEIRRDMYRPLTGSEPGLRAYYRMSNGSGLTVTDNSGNGWHGTLFDHWPAQPTLFPPNGIFPQWVTSGAFAGPRNALNLNGSTQYVSLSGNIDASSGSALTLEAWVKATDLTTNAAREIISQDDATTDPDWRLGFQDYGMTLSFGLKTSSGYQELDVSVDPTAFTDVWRHITAVYDGSAQLLYVDGALVGSLAHSGTVNYRAATALQLGRAANGSNYFAGQIDEVRFWNIARTPTAIQHDRAQTLEGATTGLVAYYRFDQSTGTAVYDQTANGNHGTLQGGPTWVPSTAFNTWIGSHNSNWANGANWSRYTVPTDADNVGLYNYPASNAPQIGSSSLARSVLIGSSATLSINSGGILRADGLWFNLGTLTVNNGGQLQQEQMVDGSVPVKFFADGNYGPFTIDGNGFNLGLTMVKVGALTNCTTGPEQTVRRCFDIDPTNSPTTGDPGTILTFSFLAGELNANACSTLNAFHWNGSGWDQLTRDTGFGVDGRQCTTEPYQLRVTGVTDFSPFMLTSENNPTAVSLQSLHAHRAWPLLAMASFAVLLLLTLAAVGARNAPGKVRVSNWQKPQAPGNG